MAVICSGVVLAASMPRISYFFLVSGSVSIFATLSCIFMTISRGVFAATNRPYHDDTLKPGTPASAKVGSSGASGERSGVDCARPRTWPDRTAWSSEPVVLNIESMRLVRRSLMAPAATPR